MLNDWNFLNKERLLPVITSGHYGIYYRTLDWTITINQEEIIFNDFEAVKKFITHYKEMKITRKELFYIFLQNKKLLAKTNKTYYRASNDYNQLNSLIYKHKNNFT